jgi:hypothetical protein
MPKEEFDPEKVIPYKNSATQILEGNKQIQKKIDVAFKKASQAKLEKFEEELKNKNTYFSRSKIQDVNEKDIKEQNETIMNKFKETGLDDNNDTYCQKCSNHRNFCPHKHKKDYNAKEKYTYPITTNNGYGWLPPIDNLNVNRNLTSVTKSFYDHSHL